MIGIFGICNLDGNSSAAGHLDTMQRIMDKWGLSNSVVLQDNSAGLGQMCTFDMPEAKQEGQPLVCHEHGLAFCTSGRVDNRKELSRLLGASNCSAEVSDSNLILQAYLRWGEACPVRIYGDWSFAVWHPKERKLFIARDHFGNTALYYYADKHVIAFASSRKALLALNLTPVEMDELYFAQVLVSWPAYHGEHTIHKPIKRLPPAHSLTVTPENINFRQYWCPKNTPELRMPEQNDYVEAFREVFDEAVRCRLRSAGNIAVTLSGGLDSGAVSATAAVLLGRENRRISAFTSVPMWNTGKYVRADGIGDEFSFARATAEYVGNIDLHRITAETISPIQAIRMMLTVNNEPSHAAGNFFWLQALRQAVSAHGCRVLLTGQVGNASISWTGSVFSQSLHFQLCHFGWRRWPKELAKQYSPASMLKAYRQLRNQANTSWNSSALHPDLWHRLNLSERMMSDPDQYPQTPLEHRCRILKPGRSLVGFRHAESGAAHGLDVRDPTADARVLAFTFSVPDHIFIDPKTGMDRWLIREAMRGRLPDEVRLNRQKGRQAADLVPRLRACAGEVNTALDELASGPAAAYVNVPYMRQVWAMVQTDDTQEAFHKSVTILTRGIMAGLWVNGFYDAS